MNTDRRTKRVLICLVIATGVILPASKDANADNADFVFGTPTLVPNVNSGGDDWAPSPSSDGLQLYLESDRAGGSGSYDLWVSTRATTDNDWGDPVNLGSTVNSSAVDASPSISTDGLSLFFCSTRPGGSGNYDLWVSTRATTEDEWGAPVNLGPQVNSSQFDGYPCISPDGLALYFTSDRTGWRIWATKRATTETLWGTPASLFPGAWPSILAHGRLLLFGGEAAGGYGGNDLWVRTRATMDGPWTEPANLGPKVNSSAWETEPTLSHDGLTLYFTSNRPGGLGAFDIWQVPILNAARAPDLNGDGKVDLADFSRLARHWVQDELSVDIAPRPYTDCRVDCKDLAVLTEYWLADYRMTAHWKLDEQDGATAYDSIGENDGTVHAEPLWQPAGGKIGGALQLDGIDNYVSARSPLDTMDLSLSVFAWIKGGAPGEVIISQRDGTMPGATWLGTDPSDGKLMTKLMDPFFPALQADSVITDGQWHHIGLVYDFDGFHRRLYVDGTEGVKDTDVVAGLLPDGDLYFGAGKDLETGSFFTGVIDDIRIYNQALSAKEIEEMAR